MEEQSTQRLKPLREKQSPKNNIKIVANMTWQTWSSHKVMYMYTVRRSCKLHPMLLLFLDELRCNLASGGRTLNHSIAILQGLCEMQDVEVVWRPYSFWAGLTTDLILVLPAHTSTLILTINLIRWLTNKSFPLDNPQSKPSIITYPYSLQWSFQTIGNLYENCTKKRHVVFRLDNNIVQRNV